MKVIELLNKIANGEELPKVIKYDGVIFELDKFENCYLYEVQDLSEFMIFNSSSLNEEVEIIEEDKKIEKLKITNSREHIEDRRKNLSTTDIALDIESLRLWINKIIDKLNEMGKE